MKPRRRLTTGELGWIGLAVYVVTVDSIAWRNQVADRYDETMSVSFGKSLQHPRTRIVTLLGWGLVTAHLFWRCPIPGSRLLKKLVTFRRI